EFFHHAPPFMKAGGTQAQVDALRLIGQTNFPTELFSPLENDAASLTFQMTRNIKVDPDLMKRLQLALGNTDAVELVTVIAAYNMVSRFLIALDVNPEEHPPA
ncbi:MAG: carboxymuconolactone decarboxylase, partial [Polynucleobacter sp. 24-46-87]